MKLKRWSQTLLAATASIGAGTGLVSCGVSNTIDYLYAVSAKNDPGQINAFRVDSQSGALTQIPDSPFPSGRDPVSLAVDSVGKSLYVVTNIDNTLEQFAIGSDAKLYGQSPQVNPSGSEPVAVSVYSVLNSDGSLNYNLVFVVETFQPNYTDLNRGPGALYVYKTNGSGTLSTPVQQTVNGAPSNFLPLGTAPTAVNVTSDGQQVFATDIITTGQTANGCSVGQGGIQGYNMQFDGSNNPTGVLTPVSGSPFCAGIAPSAVTSHPFGTFLYVTDSAQNQVTTYGITKTATASLPVGTITPLPTGPVATGTAPDGITVDPRGLYVYISNKFGPSVSGFGVNQTTGGLTTLNTGGSGVTGAQPGCIIVEPALGRFLFTANFVDGSVSGFTVDPNTGALAGTQNAPYTTSGLTQCVAATTHGNHPIIKPSAFPGGSTTP